MSGVLMTQDSHYSDHLRHYVSLQTGIEPRLTACRVSMLPTLPLGGEGERVRWVLGNYTTDVLLVTVQALFGTIRRHYWELCKSTL